MQTRRFNTHDGLSLFCRVYGEDGGGRRTAVCIPGLTRNSKDFDALAGRLSAPGYGGAAGPFRVICPDLRGRGQSDRDPNWKNYNPAVYVRDMWRMLDEFTTERVTVIGTSLGGIMAMIMAWQRPQRIEAIVVNDIGPHISRAGLQRIMEYAGKPEEIDNWDDAAAQVRAKYEFALPGMPGDFWQAYARHSFREDEDGALISEVDPNIRLAMRKAAGMRRMLNWFRKLRLVRAVRGVPIDPWDTFAAVRMPCLVIRGELSDVLSEATVEAMAAVKPDLVRVTVKGRGHAPLLNEPQALAAIDDFLARVG